MIDKTRTIFTTQNNKVLFTSDKPKTKTVRKPMANKFFFDLIFYKKTVFLNQYDVWS